MNQKNRGRKILVSAIFIASDVLIIYAVFQSAFFVRQILTPVFEKEILWNLTASFMQLGILFNIAAFYIQDLYPGYGLTAVKELERMGKSVSLAFFLIAAVSYLNKPFQGFSRSILLISWLLAVLALPLSRFAVRNIISKFSWYGMPIILFGDGAWGKQIASSLKRARRLGWYVTKIMPIKTIEHGLMDTQSEIAILAPSPELPADKYARILNKNFRKIILIRQADNLGSLWVEPRDLEGQLGLEFHYHLLVGSARWIKSLMDFGLGLALSVLLSPLFIILCLLVVLDSPGPIFFYQERLGKDFKRFKIIKFRTMVADAEQRLSEFLREDSNARAKYQKHHKLTDDPRLTRLGKWLRRYSLDELPQLWNVLKGDMSVIGPRAYLPSELDEMSDYAPIILRIQPGLTGWWQVMGRHNTTFEQRLRMDEYYISNWSLWMDYYILLKTVWVVQSGKGV